MQLLSSRYECTISLAVTTFWAALSLLLLFAYPTPELPTPSFEFHTAFDGVAFGIVSNHSPITFGIMLSFICLPFLLYQLSCSGKYLHFYIFLWSSFFEIGKVESLHCCDLREHPESRNSGTLEAFWLTLINIRKIKSHKSETVFHA